MLVNVKLIVNIWDISTHHSIRRSKKIAKTFLQSQINTITEYTLWIFQWYSATAFEIFILDFPDTNVHNFLYRSSNYCCAVQTDNTASLRYTKYPPHHKKRLQPQKDILTFS